MQAILLSREEVARRAQKIYENIHQQVEQEENIAMLSYLYMKQLFFGMEKKKKFVYLLQEEDLY